VRLQKRLRPLLELLWLEPLLLLLLQLRLLLQHKKYLL
jgi:hypothetical protein